MPLLPLLTGLVLWGVTLIEWRRGRFRSNVLEQVATFLFFASLFILLLLMWPWPNVGHRARYAMYLGLAALVAHGVVASMLGYRAGRLVPARGSWIGPIVLGLMSMLCLLGIGHVFWAPFPDDQIVIAFPLEGKWAVGHGGPSVLTNAHAPYANQRYALDLLKVGSDGKCFQADGRQLHDYLSWRQPVRSPLSGTVIVAIGTYADNEPGVEDARNSRGNHVMIRSASGEIVLLAHLRQGSIVVDEGDSVSEGQLVAEVGNSGNTSAPHVHIDASRATRDGPVSVPMVFKETGAGLRRQRRGAVLGGS